MPASRALTTSAVTTARFVLSLPDKGFCKLIRAPRQPCSQNGTGDSSAKSSPAAPDLLNDSAVMIAGSDRGGAVRCAEHWGVGRRGDRFCGSIRRGSGAESAIGGETAARTAVFGRNQAIEKYIDKTIAYEKRTITSACYLCNTHPKTVSPTASEAVPLLRVQKSSVIVMLRRRGASRGRPVRWFA